MVFKHAKPSVMTSVRISPEFYELCKKNRIQFSEAMKVGISIMLAERGVSEYDNNLNIVRRCNELKLKAASALQQATDIENNDNTKK